MHVAQTLQLPMPEPDDWAAVIHRLVAVAAAPAAEALHLTDPEPAEVHDDPTDQGGSPS